MDNLQEQLKNIMTDSLANQEKERWNQTDHFFNEICPKCHNSGWVIIEDGGQGTAVECECGIRKRMIHSNRLLFADIPESFKDVRLDNFKKSVYQSSENREMVVEIAKAVRYWLKNIESMKERGIGLYFYSGTKGSGKTRLAVSIANELIEKYDTQVKFSTSIQILDEIARTWKVGNVTESKLIHDLSNAEVLIIDDFGAEVFKDWKAEKFYSIINNRYVDKKITLFTSNLKLDDLQYDDRITNRIKERVLQVPFPEESVRDLIASQLRDEFKMGANT